METRLLLVHALSPLHAGTGQSVGAIDLPIARERPTGIPLLPGSSIKGALRARCSDPSWQRDIFGPDTAKASEHAGSVQFSDAHLLLLPVRSIAGTFAWVTSPYLLGRFARDAREAGISIGRFGSEPASQGRCLASSEVITLEVGGRRRVVLEDLDFEVESTGTQTLSTFAGTLGEQLIPDTAHDAESWRNALKQRLCIVHDDVMSLLLETATEVVARIRLQEDTKTVATGGLWYEEALPVETMLYGLAVASDVRARGERRARKAEQLLDQVAEVAKGMVQLGGKSTVGRGWCLVHLVRGAS